MDLVLKVPLDGGVIRKFPLKENLIRVGSHWHFQDVTSLGQRLILKVCK